jgi:hypothetical protein
MICINLFLVSKSVTMAIYVNHELKKINDSQQNKIKKNKQLATHSNKIKTNQMN